MRPPKKIVDLTMFDRKMQRDSNAKEREFELSFSRRRKHKDTSEFSSATSTSIFGLSMPYFAKFKRLPIFRPYLSWFSLDFMHLRLFRLGRLWNAGAFCAAAVSMSAAALVTYGYAKHSERHYLELIEQLKLNPIFTENNKLAGAIGLHPVAAKGKQLADFSFIPTPKNDVPVAYTKALLSLEDRNFGSSRLRIVCGIDVVSMFWRPISSGFIAGGSGLVTTTVKNLLANGEQASLSMKIVRYFTNIGAGCKLYKALENAGGRGAFLAFAASYLPVAQGSGTLRGITGGAHTFFDRAAGDLEDWQQILLASAVKRPIGVPRENDQKISCKKLFPRKNNPNFDQVAAKNITNRSRKHLCHTLARARVAAKNTLSSDRLWIALSQYDQLEVNGIKPANPFTRVAAKKMINLSTRTQATLPADVLKLLKSEVESYDFALGEPIFIALDPKAQALFHSKVKAKLISLQNSANARQFLCIPFVVSDSTVAAQVLAPCNQDPEVPYSPAEIFAMRTDLRTGAVKLLYSTNAQLLNARVSIASIAKWIIIVAALEAGHIETELLCPKAVSIGGQSLHRVTAPREGFANCDGGRHLITLREAIAKSDNLAVYQLARRLGSKRLSQAALKLGFTAPNDASNLPYELAFGTFGGTPAQVIVATQALAASAFNISTSGETPRILAQVQTAPSKPVLAMKALTANLSVRLALKTLLEAPIANEGTLANAKIAAGKSGTGSSTKRDKNGRAYIATKFVTAFNAEALSIDFLMISSIKPSEPLAKHDIPSNFFRSVQDVVFAGALH
jgi:hypothetical protein